MNNKTAMQQLLHQIREERTKLPLPIEWDRAYQAIEMLIQNTYIPLEKEQIKDAFNSGMVNSVDWFNDGITEEAETYYNETYKINEN
jgi:hypothetical protein